MRSFVIMLICATLGLLGSACTDMGESVPDGQGPGTDDLEHPTAVAYSYSGYDLDGSLLVTGVLNLAFGDSGEVSGTWVLVRAPGAPLEGIGPQVGNGRLAGRYEGTSIWLDLNPQFRDNNVLLAGTKTGLRITGNWDYVGFPGILRQGTFVAVLRFPSRSVCEIEHRPGGYPARQGGGE